MENHKINAAIQLLPLSNSIDQYKIIDEAIALIKNSGLKYVVCPFETVIEGNYDEVMQLIAHIKNSALKGDSEEIIINLKLHCNSKKSLFIDDKIGQYQS
ncbi:MAG: MTH1187 family thiamine-binding protein [Bacteroidota bacterium]|jgi:uncharacterized protein YqgV (UPF0045/DUF77 family)